MRTPQVAAGGRHADALRAGRAAGERTAEPGHPRDHEYPSGRTREIRRAHPKMLRIDQALQAENPTTGLLLIGMPGIGKTACALEAAHIHVTEFEEIVWHTVHPDDSSETLCAAVAPGTPAADAVKTIRARRALVVLDQLDQALIPGGTWRRPEMGQLIADLIRPDARARILLTSNRPVPIDAPQERLPLLTKSEAQLLMRQIDEQSWTVAGARPTPPLLLPMAGRAGAPGVDRLSRQERRTDNAHCAGLGGHLARCWRSAKAGATPSRHGDQDVGQAAIAHPRLSRPHDVGVAVQPRSVGPRPVDRRAAVRASARGCRPGIG